MGRLGIYLRGMAMGAADVVPGVSGGTVAFITGIYQRLIAAISACNLTALKLLFESGFAACWRHIDGNFLLLLFAGIITSVLSLANLISFLLEAYPLLVWSFFFGLIAASSWHIAKQIDRWRAASCACLIIGMLSAVLVTELKPSQLSATPLNFFVAGSIAICAMILPGISGAFLLVLMGMYQQLLAALKSLQVIELSSFVLGCLVGLMCFSRLLGWLFKHHRDTTLALLTGFLIGSLKLVWPWKQTVTYYTDRHGEQLPLVQQNVLPSQFEAITGGSSFTLWCVVLLILGVVLVLTLEKTGQKR